MKYMQFAIAIVATIGMLNSAVADEEGAKRKRAGAGAAEMRERILKEFDADGDGTLSQAEREAAKAAMAKRRGGQRGGGVDKAELMKRFDKDGDGKLNEAERKAAMAAREEMMKKRGAAGGGRRTPDPERMKEILKRFDKNEDGKLDEAERAAAKEAIGKMREGRGAGKRGKGEGGDGTAGGDEPRRPRPNKSTLLEKFDANGDGKLDETERAAAKEALKNGKKS